MKLVARYRHKDGLIKGSNGGISSYNTKEDWAYYYKKRNAEISEQFEKQHEQQKQLQQEALIKKQMEH